MSGPPVDHLEEMAATLARYEGPLDVVVDIGAHWGFFSILAADRGAPFVAAFEPHPSNYMRIAQSVAETGLTGKVSLFPFAVSRHSFDQVTLRQGGPNMGQHSIVYKKDKPGFQVPTIGFKDVLRMILGRFGKIDFLKVDIEGGEWTIFDMEDTELPSLLKKVGYIDLEMHPLSITDYYEAGQTDLSEKLRAYLIGLGFHGEQEGHPWWFHRHRTPGV